MARRSLFAFLIFLFAGLWAAAQELPRIDFSVGYTHMFGPSGCGCGINGANGSVSLNLNKTFGIVGDIGYLHQAAAAKSQSFSTNGNNAETYLFGPRFSYRKINRVQPYIQALVGTLHTTTLVGTDTSFSYELGGGVDFGLDQSGRFAIRVQGVYLNSTSSLIENGNGAYSTSLVYRFGGKIR